MQDSLIDQGLSLTLFGMGTVFTFLTVMVFATLLMSRLVYKYASKEESAAGLAPADTNPVNLDSVDSQTLSIIKKAIDAHRQR